VSDMAVDSTSIYWTNSSVARAGTVVKLAK
jgi:hypothetical protein